MWKKGNPHTLLVGMQIGVATMENSMQLPKNIKNGTALWPSDSTYGSLSEESQNTDLKEYMQPYVHFSVIHSSQDFEAAQVPISRWVDNKRWDMCPMEYHLAVKKKEILPFVTAWVDLENIMLSEISQSEKEKYHMILLICGI